MCHPLFVLKGLWALLALELRVVKGLLHKPVHLLAEAEIAAAVGAGLVLFAPLGDADAAAELIALLALFWILHDEQTDRAREVLIDWGSCIIAIEFLVLIDRCL